MEHVYLKLDAEARALRLEVSSDDFSARVTQADDPMFWIRVEVVSAEEPIITDFTRSGLDQAQMAIALAYVLNEARCPSPLRLIFRNVSMPLKDIEAEYRPVLGQYVKQRHCFLTRLETLQHDGKTTVVAEITK